MRPTISARERCERAVGRKLLDDGTLLILEGYENCLEKELDLDEMELDLGIKVLIFVVCMTLLLSLDTTGGGDGD